MLRPAAVFLGGITLLVRALIVHGITDEIAGIGDKNNQLKMYREIKCPGCHMILKDLAKDFPEESKPFWGETEILTYVQEFCLNRQWKHEVKVDAGGKWFLKEKTVIPGLPPPAFEMNDGTEALAKICKEVIDEVDDGITEALMKAAKSGAEGTALVEKLEKQLQDKFCKVSCKKSKRRKKTSGDL
mmetsp:Transcript_105340/g.198378  ORF Transcript_105340/g.198378 Transcript_105340/m.198378 type:complete len:186 (+) Transcript_105340:44-601(+)